MYQLIDNQAAARRRPDQLRGGPHKLSREEVGAHQRARIFAALGEVVAERGYEQTSVKQVIGRAGVSRKTFYELHGKREQWFLLLCERIGDRLVERLERAALTSRDGDPGLAAVLALVDFCADDPGAARTCLVETLAAGERGRAWRALLIDRIAAVIAGDDDDSLVDPRAELSARAAVGAVVELTARGPGPLDREYAAELVSALLAADRAVNSG